MDHDRFKRGEFIGDLGTLLFTIGISGVGVGLIIAGVSHWNKLQEKRRQTRPTRIESAWPSILIWFGLLVSIMPWIAHYVFGWW